MKICLLCQHHVTIAEEVEVVQLAEDLVKLSFSIGMKEMNILPKIASHAMIVMEMDNVHCASVQGRFNK